MREGVAGGGTVVVAESGIGVGGGDVNVNVGCGVIVAAAVGVANSIDAGVSVGALVLITCPEG